MFLINLKYVTVFTVLAIILLSLAFLFWFSNHFFPPNSTSEAKDSIKVLFLGNSVLNANGGSLVHFHGFCSAAKIECKPVSHFEYFGRTKQGRINPFICNQVKDKRIISLIKSAHFDYVILVTRSTDFLNKVKLQDTIYAFRQMHKMVVTSGAKTVLFMAYTPMNAFSTMPCVAEGHRKVKEELEAMIINRKQHKVILVPIGLLWVDGMKKYGKNIWYSDPMHGRKIAQYANGCLWYAYLTGKDPRNNLFMNNVSKEQSEWIKNRVWWYMNNYK